MLAHQPATKERLNASAGTLGDAMTMIARADEDFDYGGTYIVVMVA
ncbi:hypothetical protein A2U01_0055845, partial [Trifolium medium]|nr:hypothetical protein [Trifolium medium]